MALCVALLVLGGVVAMIFSSLFDETRSSLRPGHSSWRESSGVSDTSLKLQPHQHVYYLKTIKTGSTTMFSILSEYCRTHDLLPLLPKYPDFGEAPGIPEEIISFAGDVSKYDMVFNHHVFTPKFMSYLHADTFTMTTLREPFDTFVSAFNYYSTGLNKKEYLASIPGDDPMMTFLTNPSNFEANGYQSYTNNRQSMDLGYDLSHSFDNVDHINKFIKETEARFNLVMITEYFDESLVMMKRLLNWRTEDIIYLSQNANGPDTSVVKDAPAVEARKRELHAGFYKGDIMLYEHFLQLFKTRMSEEIGLSEEVNELKDILEKIRNYCGHFPSHEGHYNIEKGTWSNGFQITSHKCKWLEKNEISMTFYLKARQYAMMSDQWWESLNKEQKTMQ